MGVNSLHKTVTRQRRGCDLNPGPSAPDSSTLTTRLPSVLVSESYILQEDCSKCLVHRLKKCVDRTELLEGQRRTWLLMTVVDDARVTPLTLNVTRSSRYGRERSGKILCVVVATLKIIRNFIEVV